MPWHRYSWKKTVAMLSDAEAALIFPSRPSKTGHVPVSRWYWDDTYDILWVLIIHCQADGDSEFIIRLRHYGLFRVLKPREPLDSPTLALSNGAGTPRSLRTPSPSPRRRAESVSELVDVEEVDEDGDEEIPGRTGDQEVSESMWKCLKTRSWPWNSPKFERCWCWKFGGVSLSTHSYYGTPIKKSLVYWWHMVALLILRGGEH